MELLNIDYKDWLLNQKRIPDKESAEAESFFEWHKQLCMTGFMMDGVFINPFLYWHLNMWNTEVDMIDSNGYISQKYRNPYLRDNEWIITNEIHNANIQKKGLAIGGIRRLSKSVTEASYIAWGASFDENSQNIISGLNAADIKLVTDKIDKGLNFLPWYYKWDRIEDNWKNQVTLGIKSKGGERMPFSAILIRNLDEGNNEEAIAGTKPRKLIIDEALEENSILYTSTENIKIKDVKSGQKIYGDDGKLTIIKDKIDVGVVDIWEITLKDGRKIQSSENHQWSVYNTYLKKYVLTTTENIKNKYFFEKKDNKSFIYSIPNNNSINYQEKDLEIDPYYLGLWIGDGVSSKPNIVCSIDDEIIEECEKFGNKYNLSSTIRKDKNKNEKFRYVSLVNKEGSHNIITTLFKEENLINNKHIPKKYLYSSYNQRLELLKGLMDTDGCCTKKGNIEFSTSIPQLAEDFFILCRGLGISVYKKEKTTTYTYKGEKKIGKLSYRFSIYTGIRIFKLKRKIDNYNLSRRNNNSKKQKAYKERCTIVDVKYIGKKQAYCIKVDNNSNLFLTNDYTVTHNCGKGKFLRGLQAAIPGFTTQFGWGCSPIVTFTGGDMKKFFDAKQLMFDCEAFNFLEYKDVDNDKRFHGLFLGHTYRMEAKVNSTLGNFLKKPKKSPLHEIFMQVSDYAIAEKVTDENLARAKKANDRHAYLKEKMYYPKKVDDIFLNEDTNIFDIEACKRQQIRLSTYASDEWNVELFFDEGKIKWKRSEKRPIEGFPVKPGDDKDAPIVIWEHPVPDPPYGLYVAGVDPYRQGKAKYSDSLGAVYIYKRMHAISGEEYQDMFVACYVARPDNKEVWEDQARLLCKYYNARVLCENDEISFIEYMKAKGDSHLLVKMVEVNWLKEAVTQTTVSREFGIHRSNPKIIDYLHATYKKYLESTILKEENEDGSTAKEILGVAKILDRMLLEETIQFNDKGNFDRLTAVELAIAQANIMDPIIGRIQESDPRIDALFRKPLRGNKLLLKNRTNNKRKLFT